MLPIARVTRVSSLDEEIEGVARYEHEFVSRDSLAEGFLDWLCHRFSLRFRDVEELIAERVSP